MSSSAISENEVNKPKETGALNLRVLKKIVTIMNRAKITELDIEQDGVKIHLRRGPGAAEPMPMYVPAPPMPLPTSAHHHSPTSVAQTAEVKAAVAEDSNLHTIASPMVGTFYRSPSPNAEPFVEVGKSVNADTVVCIVEAMKLMNEIKAEVNGVIRKILVENAQAIEFGQPLFLVERQ